MASPHSHYSQPGPSSLQYHPPPPHYAFGGNPPYQLPHQHPPNLPPQRMVNGVGRGGYPHQGPGRPGPAYHPHYPPPQPYQPGLYSPLEHQHVRPPGPHYPQHYMNGGPMHMGRAPNSPNRPPQFMLPNTPRHPPPHFSPPFHPHVQHYPHPSPGHSPSALPKQLLMPPPQSPVQNQLPLKPAPHVQPEPPPPLATSPSQGSRQTSTPPPSSPAQQSSSPIQPSAPLQSSSTPQPAVLTDEPSSPVPTSPNISHREPLTPYEAFPERSNPRYSLKYRRPDVLAASAVNVSRAARPPRSYYVLTAHLDDDPVDPPAPAPAEARPTTPEPAPAPSLSKPYVSPDSPMQRSLASSATTTTSTSPHTPTPGSPMSSITSVSLPTKSPSSNVLASPAPSVGAIPTEEVVAKPAPPPLKKSWASLLRPASTAGSSTDTPTSPNSLPTSSVQGFSIPASPSTSTPVKTAGPPAALTALLTAPHLPTGPTPPLRARGLVNLGNMCFANTVLQVLVFCPPFYHFFMELARTPRGDAPRPTPLIDATVEFMKEFQVQTPPVAKSHDEEDSGRDAFVPTCIYDGLKEKKRFDSMRGGQQEDAEEFLGFYLDTLEEELLSMVPGLTPLPAAPAPIEEHVEKESQADGWLEVGKKNKSVITRTHKSLESPISRIFGGRFRTTLKVPGARESVMVDPWSRLQLDIQPDYVNTIEDALHHSATPGTVQVTRPGAQVDASQQTLIDALPSVLVLHLKRFLYDTTVGDVVKLRKRIAFGTELEVPKEALVPARRTRAHKYRLFGVLNHHGSSATGGHYTLDVLHPSMREGWLRIDDEVVQNVRADDLAARDLGDDRTAYLLFYQRILPPGSRM